MEDLPDEILLHIFEYLPPYDLLNCASVCHRFNRVTVDNHLWAQHIENRGASLADALPGIKRRTVRGRSGNELEEPILKLQFKQDIEQQLEQQNELWREHVIPSFYILRRGSLLFNLSIAFIILFLLIWGLIHNGTHSTSADFYKNFHSNWGGMCIIPTTNLTCLIQNIVRQRMDPQNCQAGIARQL